MQCLRVLTAPSERLAKRYRVDRFCQHSSQCNDRYCSNLIASVNIAAMLAVERRRRIAEIIRSRGVVGVAEMAEVLGASEVTLRCDLRVMAGQGLLMRTHGGAVLPAGLPHEPTYSEKANK